jgi:phosphoenolpyruvate-protein kinase (PTS system EI component)
MYLPARDWDGINMGKTIALKLTKKEEQFISEVNSKGMTNSELLRSALRQYVQSMQEVSSEGSQMKNIFVKQENVSADFLDIVQQLKSDMQVVQGQLERIQKQVENDVQTLQQQLSLLTSNAPNIAQCTSSEKQENLYDVHQQIDQFLCKQTHQNAVKEETVKNSMD